LVVLQWGENLSTVTVLLIYLLKLLSFGPAHRAGTGWLLLGRVSTHRTHVIGTVSLFTPQTVEELLIELGVHLLDFVGIRERPFSILVPLGLGRFDHLRVHVCKFVGLALDGVNQVLFGPPDGLEGPQVVMGVYRLRLGGRPKETGHLGITILMGLGGIGQILAIGLGLTGKGLVQIIVCLGHLLSLPLL
jgi:hypothetical protein